MTRLAVVLRVACLPLAALAAACGGVERAAAPETGAVHVTLATTGSDLDPDGYTVLVNGAVQAHVGIQADTNLIGVPAGTGSVTLTGLAANCSTQPTMPLAVTVLANQSVDVGVTVHCAATTGFLRLWVQGSDIQDQDPDGYFYRIDAGATVAIGNQAAVIPVSHGDHHLTLSGLAANCEIAPGLTWDFYVGAGDTTEVDFAVGCSLITSAIQVTTSTTGAVPDPNGYSISIDGAAVAMGINDSHLFTGIAPGTHLVRITGIAPNCILYSPDETTAITGADWYMNPLTITFPVVCPEVGTLRVETPIVPQTGWGFAFFVEDTAYPLGVTDTTYISNIPIGDHVFSVRIPEDGCVATPNGGTFTIAANQFTDLPVSLDCPPPAVRRSDGRGE